MKMSMLLLFCLSGCIQTPTFLVEHPAAYGYITQRVTVKGLWPDGSGKLVEAQGELPPDTVILVPADGGPAGMPSTRPAGR